MAPTVVRVDAASNVTDRKKIVLRRFRAIARLAYHNRYWVGEYEDVKLTDNVRRNIMLLTKEKKILSSLTMYEKSLLNKPIKYRTEAEKLHLSKVIGGLSCFRKYPPRVQKALAGATYFVYYPPNRPIVKQHHKPYALYFLLSGSCLATVGHYDAFLDEWIEQETGVLGPGTTFGDISLLHDIERLHTITTLEHCELLMVKKENFHTIIKDTIEKFWKQVQAILDKFPYFKNWDEMLKREASIITDIKSYEPDETVFGDDIGQPQQVYFVIKGSCCLIENLSIRKCKQNGITKYLLAMDDKSEDPSMTLAQIFKKYRKYLENAGDVSSGTSCLSTPRTSARLSKKLPDFSGVRVSVSTALDAPTALFSSGTKLQDSAGARLSAGTASSNVSRKSKTSTKIKLNATTTPSGPSKNLQDSSGSRKSVRQSKGVKLSCSTLTQLRDDEWCTIHFDNADIECQKQTRLMKICDMKEGACFNIGEEFRRRRVVAVTPTTCLLLPRFWILRNNQDNVWSMLKQFLDNRLPSTEQIFEIFVRQQKFNRYRKKLVSRILEEKFIGTGNSIHNVPYSIRLNDGVDTEYFNISD